MKEAMEQARTRRRLLIERMVELGAQKMDCQKCQGDCCTSRANSMQISPLEASELVFFLKNSGRIGEPGDASTNILKERLEQCVQEYRLDKEIPRSGSRPNLRRTYTCPFYQGGARGCQIDRDFKPLGCLAFNPHTENSIALSAHCWSEQDRLSQAVQQSSLLEASEQQKLPIPLAVLAVLNQV